MKNPTARWVTIGGMFRFLEGATKTYFLPAFYQQTYPSFMNSYGLINCLVQSVGGCIAVVMGGVLGDVFEKKTKMAKAYVAIFGALLGIPMMAGCSYFAGMPFYWSMFFSALEFIVSEGWMASTITMM